MRRKLLAAAQAAVTIVLLAVLFRGFDWTAFRALALRLPPWFYVTSLAVVVAGILAYAWRWRVLLACGGIHLPYALVLQQYVIGVFVSNFLPSTIGGDAAKVFYLGRDHGYRAVTASIVVDRLLGLGILSALATLTLWSGAIVDPRYATARLVLTAITAGFAAALVFTAQRGGVARAVRSPAVWLKSVLTVAGYFLLVALVYRGFLALQADLHPSFLAVLTAVTTTAVLSNVPITINGLGLREQLHVLLLQPLGVPKELAVAISLLLFGHLLIVSLAGGLLWWRLPAVSRPIVEG